jgi:hypothetical protein
MFRHTVVVFALILGAIAAASCGGATNQAASTSTPRASFTSTSSSKSGKEGASGVATQTATQYPPVQVKPPRNRCAPQTDYDFVNVLPCDIGRAGKSIRRIQENCGVYVANDFSDPRCAKIIKRNKFLMRQAWLNLHNVGIPTGLGSVDAALLLAIKHDLQAANTALAARQERNWPEFMRAWGQLGRAGLDFGDAVSALKKWYDVKAAQLEG